MRILQIITLCELGGAQAVVANLSNYLSHSHEVIVAAGEGDGGMFKLLDKAVKIERIPSLQRAISPMKEVKAIREMRKLYKKYNPDIVHLHSSKAGMLGRVAFPKSKTIYTVHGFDSIRLAYRKFLPIEKMMQHRCSAVVGVSRYDEKNLKDEGIVNNVHTIYNGIYPPKKLDKDPFSIYRQTKGIVLCIARLAPPKNHRLFCELARRFPDHAFLWIGNLQEPDFDYPDNVHFLGNIPHAGSYIKYADLFLLTSEYEGLPIVIIEALASGVPIISSKVGGVPELLDGEYGHALENNPDIMAPYIGKMLSLDPAQKAEMENAATDKFKKEFTIGKMAEGYIDIYNKLIKTK